MITKLKEQAASIASEKITEIIDMIPALRNEIDWSPGKTKLNSKDYVEVFFKNGSKFDVVAAKNSSRGGRRHGGLVIQPLYLERGIENLVNL